MLALAIVAPFGSALMTVFGAAPIQYTEALVLATLSGVCIAAAWDGNVDAPQVTPSLGWPAALFAGVVVASLGVALGVGEVGLESRRLLTIRASESSSPVNTSSAAPDSGRASPPRCR